MVLRKGATQRHVWACRRMGVSAYDGRAKTRAFVGWAFHSASPCAGFEPFFERHHSEFDL
jgi:hypothetical protein